MNEVMKSLLSHQSIRAYTEQMVEEEKINQIIQAVQAAPNWNNRAGKWTDIAADFYKHPYDHYPEVPEMLKQQGFYSGCR